MDIEVHPCVLPEDGPSRDFLDPSFLNRPNCPPREELNYDFKTIFYDVWISENGTRLHALAPPFLNLERILFPIQISIDGIGIKYQINAIQGTPLKLLTGVIATKSDAVREVLFVFNSGLRYELALRPTETFSPGIKILGTLQKNNRISWLRDWISHYRGLGFDSIVIYDNGSEGMHSPRLLKTDSSVHIVNWPFPFGITIAGKNKYAQQAALNHLWLRFAPDNSIGNFDIDEILIIDKEILKKSFMKRVEYFPGIWVPPLGVVPTQDYSFRSFKVRESRFMDGGMKFVYRSSLIKSVKAHYVLYLPIPLERCRRVFRIIRKITEYRTKRKGKGFFYHYKAITTNWKSEYSDRFTDEKRVGTVPMEIQPFNSEPSIDL